MLMQIASPEFQPDLRHGTNGVLTSLISAHFISLELHSVSFNRGSVVVDLYPGSAYSATFGNIQVQLQATGSTTTGIF